MNLTMQIIGLLAVAYLLGSIPFGVIVAKAKGVDILKTGSGNPGATNVGRVLGRKYGILVLLLDMAKGATASLMGRWFLYGLSQRAPAVNPDMRDWIWLGTGVACIAGNLASPFLRFKGGKGVATSFGVILGIYPFLTLPGIVAGLIWALVVRTTRYVSAGSIVASVSLPASFVLIGMCGLWRVRDHVPLLILTIAVPCFVLVRHRSNIGRLMSGTENKIGPKRVDDPSA